MSKRVTTKELIEKARAVHGDRYDYSAVHYVAAIQDVIIICPEHGEFSQRPANHLSGKMDCLAHSFFFAGFLFDRAPFNGQNLDMFWMI